MIKHNLERGFYQVADKIFTNKMLALYEASTLKIQPKFNFHDEIYSQLDWTLRPAGTLRDLYKQRAQQLRDEYDYITINFSGGPDSWNVLNSFISNNIKVDEIYTRWGLAERKFTAPNNIDLDERNTNSEFEYAVLPVLNYLKKNHPTINIVVDDISECFQTELTEKIFLNSDQYQMASCFFHTVRQSDKEKQAEKNNKKIGVVYGYDKIKCKSVAGNFYAYFSDGMCGGDATSYNSLRKFECFYWSPHFPYIPILQVHYLKDFLQEHYLKDFFKKKNDTTYRQLYMNVCYPEYNKETFQTKKMLGSIVSKSDLWIEKYNSRYFRSWKWHVSQYINNIDTDYICYKENAVVGLKNLRSKDYLVATDCKLPNISWGADDCLPITSIDKR